MSKPAKRTHSRHPGANPWTLPANLCRPGSRTKYGYDTASRLATVGNGTNSATYSYVANSPLVEQIEFKQNGTVRLTRNNYFDKLNRLTNLVWTAGGATVASFAYEYNRANQRTRVTLADGSYWLYEYDGLGQVTSARRYWSEGTPVAGQQNTYAFDDIGNRTTVGRDSRRADYYANLLNQYTNRTVPGFVNILGQATNTATVTVNTQPTYRHGDYFRAELAVTNTSPLWVGITNFAVLNQGTNADLVATNLGRLFAPQTPEAFHHDLDGNLTNDGRWTYTWDAENRVTSFTRLASAPDGAKVKVDCAYDYRGRRTQKIVSTWNGSGYVAQSTNRYLYNGWNLITILNETNGLVQSFVWGTDASGTMQGAGGVGGLLSMTLHQGANAGTYFYCYDGNHNVTALVDAANGAVAAYWEYDAFLNVLRATGPLAFGNPLLGSTKFYDWETGFYYYGYRYYDPDTGRWLNRDPIGERGGVQIYSFVQNRPLLCFDDTGLKTLFGINFGGIADEFPNTRDCEVKKKLRKQALRGLIAEGSKRSPDCSASPNCTKLTLVIKLGKVCASFPDNLVGHTGIGIQDDYYDFGPNGSGLGDANGDGRPDGGNHLPGGPWLDNPQFWGGGGVIPSVPGSPDEIGLAYVLGRISTGDYGRGYDIITAELCVCKAKADEIKRWWDNLYKAPPRYDVPGLHCTSAVICSLEGVPPMAGNIPGFGGKDDGAYIYGGGASPVAFLARYVRALRQSCGPQSGGAPHFNQLVEEYPSQ